MSKQRIPNPYEETVGKTEWTCAALVAQWINEIIKEKNLDLGDALVKVIMENIRGETLGMFFKSELAQQRPLTNKSLPRSTGDVHVVQELFDWYLYLDSKKVKCGSELEARYLKVWAEAGIEQVKIPKEEKILKTIMPKLEKLKSTLVKIVRSHLNSILDRKTRAQIAHFVWAELVK